MSKTGFAPSNNLESSIDAEWDDAFGDDTGLSLFSSSAKPSSSASASSLPASKPNAPVKHTSSFASSSFTSTKPDGAHFTSPFARASFSSSAPPSNSNHSSSSLSLNPAAKRKSADEFFKAAPTKLVKTESPYWKQRFAKQKPKEEDFISLLDDDSDTESGTRGAPAPIKPLQKITLSPEQEKVLEIACSGQSIFFTGAAGTGKSFLLHSIIDALRRQHGSSAVAVTSSTGLAALNINGETLHRFSGLGIAQDSEDKLLAKLRNSQFASNRWRQTKVLIIDEISMVDGAFFKKLDYCARKIRGVKQPFGGIQLICTGDFFQLPPVTKGNQKRNFCFETKAWQDAIKVNVVLTTVFRQQGDDTLIKILNAMRFGELTPEMIKMLRQLNRTVDYHDDIEPTELYATRNLVEGSNQKRLSQLKGTRYIYTHTDEFNNAASEAQKKLLINKMNDGVMASPVTELRRNCQVMVVRNLPEKDLVNGSMGKVVAFLTPKQFSNVTALKDDPTREKYIELLQATEEAEMKARVEGRKQRSEDVFQQTCGRYGEIVLPIIRFSRGTSSDGTPYFSLVQIPVFDFEFRKNDIRECSRLQLPLILSWAMSIHKAQGQTLDRVKVNLGNIFETGHAYVALSRAVSMDRLEITNFKPERVTCDKTVLEFYNNLEQASLLQVDEEKSNTTTYNISKDPDDGFDED